MRISGVMGHPMYDLVIIGGGPAGLTAGIYGSRCGLRTLILEKGKVGGALFEVPWIDNYPGFENVAGQRLLERFEAHARRYSEIKEFTEVTGVEKLGDGFRLVAGDGEYRASALILATGASRKKLGVKGESEFSGKGVSYCPMCDGYSFRGKNVAVVGGGDAAVVDAIFLRDMGCRVTLIHRRERLRAEVANVKALQNVELCLNSVVEEIVGDRFVDGVVIKDVLNGTRRKIQVSGVFISVGTEPNSSIAKILGANINNEGYVVVDRNQRTNVEKFYAAGDVTGGARQVVVACAEGAVAATSAFEDLKHPYWSQRGV
ncbi:MAG: FAD-dependent oxidoreductase [Candidatus Hadarchaeales archaeon]